MPQAANLNVFSLSLLMTSRPPQTIGNIPEIAMARRKCRCVCGRWFYGQSIVTLHFGPNVLFETLQSPVGPSVPSCSCHVASMFPPHFCTPSLFSTNLSKFTLTMTNGALPRIYIYIYIYICLSLSLSLSLYLSIHVQEEINI